MTMPASRGAAVRGRQGEGWGRVSRAGTRTEAEGKGVQAGDQCGHLGEGLRP